MPIYKGRFEEGSVCPPRVAKKLREEAARSPVGIVQMMAATSDMVGGLGAALREAVGLEGLKVLVEQLGGQLTINLDQGDAKVLALTIGQCNNKNGNFHENGSALKTAKVLRAAEAAVPISDSGTDVFRGNSNLGHCARRINGKGDHNCRLLTEYTADQVGAMREAALVIYEKVSESYPDAEVLLVHKFGNYSASKHTGPDGKPVVTHEITTAKKMAVYSCTTKHLSLAPGDVTALRSIVEGRLELKGTGERKVGRFPGTYTEADVIKGVLDTLEIIVTGQEEPDYIVSGWDKEKTDELVVSLDGLREKESLQEVLVGAAEVGEAYGPRGYTFENRSAGGERETCRQSTFL